MPEVKRFVSQGILVGGVCVLITYLLAPLALQAQATSGNKAVYDSNGNCCTYSTAFVDASVLAGSDICQQIYSALQLLPAGGVVDARGIPAPPSAPASCSGTETPWHSGSDYTLPSTVLLPTGTIVINSPWIMPDGTRLVGQGTGSSDSGGTVLQAGSSLQGAMIKMGDSAHCLAANHICHGISVEDLILDGEGIQGVSGIANTNAQELSYVNHVKFFQVLGTGLSISGSAQNSGPYTNITFDTGGIAPVSGTSCAQITGLAGTRGIHGLTCIASSNDSTAAVFLDASNNSIEDVRIVGFYDGVLVGASAAAHSNVLINILGDTSPPKGVTSPVHVVHISANNNNVSDLSIMGINNVLGGGLGQYAIEDDLTSTTLPDSYVAVYALGEQSGNSYSRFTTSPNAATWAVGASAPVGGCTATNLGSLYSTTLNTSGSLWVCENSLPGGPAWAPVL